ncbi:MAG TPA: nitroreductase family protein [Bacteroidales bacterium]|nr:nitroreductase family protein [Bacteroidales bacterium]
MKTLLELVKSRQSERAYDINRPVESEKLDYILETVRLAPSACNAQPWKFIVVTDPSTVKETASCVSDRTLGMNHFAYQAPVIIVVLEEAANFTSTIGSKVKQKHFPHMDLGIAAAHIILAAAEQGLGSCIVGWFDEKKIRNVLEIPTSKRPVLVITMGYATQNLREKKRKNLSDIVSYNKYR